MVMALNADKRTSNRYIGQRVKKARHLAGMSQAQLSEAIEVAQDAVSRYESGYLMIGAYLLGRIAKATGQPLKFFYGEPGTTEPIPGELNFRCGPVARLCDTAMPFVQDGEPGGFRTHDTRIKSHGVAPNKPNNTTKIQPSNKHRQQDFPMTAQDLQSTL